MRINWREDWDFFLAILCGLAFQAALFVGCMEVGKSLKSFADDVHTIATQKGQP